MTILVVELTVLPATVGCPTQSVCKVDAEALKSADVLACSIPGRRYDKSVLVAEICGYMVILIIPNTTKILPNTRFIIDFIRCLSKN